MFITEGATAAVEPLTRAEAIRQLRISGHALDAEVRQAVSAAREYCEQYTGRTLLASVVRTLQLDHWPSGKIRLPFPPLQSVGSIKYYADGDAAQTTLGTTNYHVATPTHDIGVVVWDDTFTAPSLDDRPDAVEVEYTAGYTTIPPMLKQAIKVRLLVEFGNDTDSRLAAAERRCNDILNSWDAQQYA